MTHEHVQLSGDLAAARAHGLSCSQAQASAINAVLPLCRVEPVPMYGGGYAICADVLTDPSNYGAAFHLLGELEIVDWVPFIPPTGDE
jgi:hypothetical protein